MAVTVTGWSMGGSLCLVTCASMSPSAASAHGTHGLAADHSCHDSATTALPRLGALPHACAHDDPELLSASAQTAAGVQAALFAPALATAAVIYPPAVAAVWAPRRVRVRGAPPLPLAGAPAPLRI